MEQVIKTYLGIFLMMLLSTVGIGIVAAEAQICQARNFKSDVVVELENSNYNREVINACIKQADELRKDGNKVCMIRKNEAKTEAQYEEYAAASQLSDIVYI